MLKKLSLADIALTIAKPSALTIEAVFIAARKTVDLKLANGWKGSCVCGFNEVGDLSALWLGETIEDDLLDSFPDYGFSIGHGRQDLRFPGLGWPLATVCRRRHMQRCLRARTRRGFPLLGRCA